MGDIFREIDEELRQERYEKLWQEYGRYVIAAAVIAILSVGGWQGWKSYTTAKRETESAQFAAAGKLLGEGKKSEAVALFSSLARDAGGGYAALAKFREAALLADSGDPATAVRIYDSLAADSALQPSLRDAAVVFAATYSMDQPGASSDELRSRLEPLVSGNSPWRHSARELIGLLALRAGDEPGARELFRQLADDLDAPQQMRSRAAQILAVLGG